MVFPIAGGGLPKEGQALKSYLGAGYIRATQSLSILAALSALVSVIFLILSYVPSLSIRGYGPLSSSIMAFAAGRLRAALGLWGLVSFCRGSEPSLIFIPSHFCCGGHGGLYQRAVEPASTPSDPDLLLLVVLPGLGFSCPLSLYR